MKKLMLLTGIFAFLLFSCEDHDWQWVVTRAATNGQDGEEIETCSIHGDTRGKPRVIHYWGNWEQITPTDEICSGEVKKCVNCGIEGEKRNIVQHNWGAWEITTPATEEADGSRKHTCQTCNKTVTEIIPKIGLETRRFYAQSFRDGSFYQLNANLLADGQFCKVYAETTSSVTKATAESVRNEYDNNVYSKMISNFGIANSQFNFANELAAINVAEEGKLIILLLDIRDNYQAGVNESSVGGYFLWSDLFISEDSSNGRAMIYIDTSPGVPGSLASNMTLAHEMQHLINEVTSQELRDSVMDLWIDEGLSTAAEWVYSGSHPQNRWGWYHNNGNGVSGSGRIQSAIDKGNNFYVWGNRPENAYAEIDDYATAYLFFQWLRLQSGGVGIYKDIIGSAYSNYRAVTSAAAKFDPNYNDNWDGLLRDWLAANYINTSSGRYGYANDSTLRTLNKHLLTTSGTTPLYPGEGVFSKINASYNIPSNNGDIKYSLLTSSGISNQTTITSGALLTYNVNTVNNDDGYFPSPEDGTVTGVASISVVDGRFVSPPVVLSGPFWVSGGDVLRRNGSLGLPPAGVTRPSIRVAR